MNTRYLFVSSSLSINQVFYFWLYRSFTSTTKFITMYFIVFLCYCEWGNFPYFFFRCFTVSIKRCNYFFWWFYILQLYWIHWLALRAFCWVWKFLCIKWYHLQLTPPPHSNILFCIFLYIWPSQNVLFLYYHVAVYGAFTADGRMPLSISCKAVWLVRNVLRYGFGGKS